MSNNYVYVYFFSKTAPVFTAEIGILAFYGLKTQSI